MSPNILTALVIIIVGLIAWCAIVTYRLNKLESNTQNALKDQDDKITRKLERQDLYTNIMHHYYKYTDGAIRCSDAAQVGELLDLILDSLNLEIRPSAREPQTSHKLVIRKGT